MPKILNAECIEAIFTIYNLTKDKEGKRIHENSLHSTVRKEIYEFALILAENKKYIQKESSYYQVTDEGKNILDKMYSSLSKDELLLKG